VIGFFFFFDGSRGFGHSIPIFRFCRSPV